MTDHPTLADANIGREHADPASFTPVGTDQERDRTAEAENAARLLYRSDWDEHGTTSVHLPAHIATAILRGHGWARRAKRGQYAGWVSPNGHRCWELDEALQLALTTAVYDQANREDRAAPAPSETSCATMEGGR